MALFVVPSALAQEGKDPFFAIKCGAASCYCLSLPDEGEKNQLTIPESAASPSYLGSRDADAELEDVLPSSTAAGHTIVHPAIARRAGSDDSSDEEHVAGSTVTAPTKACVQSKTHQAALPQPSSMVSSPKKISFSLADTEAAKPVPMRTLPPIVNGCGCIFDVKEAEQSGTLRKDDPIQAHYKKQGFFGAITGAFGDKKTMYCHHLTSTGEFGVRAAARAGVRCTTVDEVWDVLGKNPCHGRFAYDRSTGKLKCGSCIERDHDATCNKETCLFIASGLPCPTPQWALK